MAWGYWEVFQYNGIYITDPKGGKSCVSNNTLFFSTCKKGFNDREKFENTTNKKMASRRKQRGVVLPVIWLAPLRPIVNSLSAAAARVAAHLNGMSARSFSQGLISRS
jgi:hypothetical protein